jgi:hypothetical protein
MDRRLVFRPYLCFVETTVTQSGTPSAPIGHGASLPYSKGAGEVETTVKATGTGLCWLEKPVVEGKGTRTANRHWWVGVSAPRWAREPSSRNSAISPRNFGRRGTPDCQPACPGQQSRVAVNRPRRLFNKNTGLRKPVRGRMGADACPVPEG